MRLKQLGIMPIMEQLKKLSLIKDHCKYMQDLPVVKAAIAASGPIIEDRPAKKSLETSYPHQWHTCPLLGKRYANRSFIKSDLHLIERFRNHRECERERAKPP